MLDTLRLVSSEDVGRDEASAESLLKKHRVSPTSLYLCLFLDNYTNNMHLLNVMILFGVIESMCMIKLRKEQNCSNLFLAISTIINF